MTRLQGWITVILLTIVAANFVLLDVLVIHGLEAFSSVEVPTADPSITFGPTECPSTDPNWPGC